MGTSDSHYEELLARLIEEVLRSPFGVPRLPDLADSAGYSRSHLTRLFHRTTGETLDNFLRRISLERAAYSLTHSNKTVYHQP